jgi:hypothetical protein
VLIDLKALFAFVGRYQLNLCVGQAFGRQVGQHLMAEQMRVQRKRQSWSAPFIAVMSGWLKAKKFLRVREQSGSLARV